MLPACKCSICRKSKAESTAKGSLKPEEAAVLALLRSRLAKEAEQSEGSRAKGSSGKQRVASD
jgi:hypothetical protein